MKLFELDKALKRFTATKRTFELIDGYETNLMNYLPEYIGSDFPDAPPPNRVEAQLNELKNLYDYARYQLSFATQELILELQRYKERDYSFISKN